MFQFRDGPSDPGAGDITSLPAAGAVVRPAGQGARSAGDREADDTK
ncbi:hypothetical protein [Methanoregula sp.]